VHVEPAYLQLARDLCTAHGSVLVFDEVMSGFRAHIQGAGARLGVVPDLATFGKAIANGYVIAVLAGRADLMTQLAPEGRVFFSGTFNGHPLSAIAAQATLDVLERDDVPARSSSLGDRMAGGINTAIAEHGLNAVCQTFGSVWNLYFGTTAVRSYRDLALATTDETRRLGAEYLAFLRRRGIYVHQRYVNRAFISAAHDEDDIDFTIATVREFLVEKRRELAL
jgi:glutamate-1-semialdehyde 2,1-aminomutase